MIRVQIVHKLAPQFNRKGMTIFKAVATDGVSDVTVVMYNNQYGFQALHPGSWYRMSGKIQGNLLRREIHAPHVLADNSKELIYPAYPLTSGITANLLVRAVKQALELMKAQPFSGCQSRCGWNMVCCPWERRWSRCIFRQIRR